MIHIQTKQLTISIHLLFLGNGGVGILLLSTNDGGEEMAMNQSESRTHDVKVLRSSDETRMSGMPSFLGDSIDWSGVRLSGE